MLSVCECCKQGAFFIGVLWLSKGGGVHLFCILRDTGMDLCNNDLEQMLRLH